MTERPRVAAAAATAGISSFESGDAASTVSASVFSRRCHKMKLNGARTHTHTHIRMGGGGERAEPERDRLNGVVVFYNNSLG